MTALRTRLGPVARVLAGQGIASLSNFLTVLALGRWGGESALGAFALGWSCWFLVMSLGDTLIATPYTYFRAQREQLADDLAATAAWGILLLCAAAALILTAMWGWNLLRLGSLWPALPSAIVAASIREFVRRHLLASGDLGTLLRVDSVGALVQLAGIASLAALGRLTAGPAFWVMSAAAVFAVAPWVTFAYGRRLLAARAQAPAVLARFLGYGRWLMFGGICHVASVQAYPWLAYSAGGERLTGLFAACNALLNMLSPLLTGLTNYFRPRFMAAQVHLSAPEFAGYVLRSIPAFAGPAVGLLIGLHLAGEFLLSHLYGPAFALGAPAVSWLGLGLLAGAVAAPLQLALLALHAPSTNVAYHGSALTWLAVGAWLSTERLTLLDLSRLYCGGNLLATCVLAVLFIVCRNRTRPGKA